MNKNIYYIVAVLLIASIIIALLIVTLPGLENPTTTTSSPITTTHVQTTPSLTTTILTTTTTVTTTTTTTYTTYTTQTTTPPSATNLTKKYLQVIQLIDRLIRNNFSLVSPYNSTLLRPVFVSAEYMYRAQLLYDKYGGHGLIPLVSLRPDEILYYFSPYSLEVSEFSAELPWIYAWLYWVTGNTTWLNLTKYSVDAVKYWSVDYVPLGGCWGVTDPIVYDESLGKYVIRWKLLTWYTQSQISWWYDDWFNESTWHAWNYTAWYDPRYDWYWFTPWEIVHYGPPSEYEKYKRSFMSFVHSWIDHKWWLDNAPYAYIFNASSVTLGPYVSRDNDEIVFDFDILQTRRTYVVVNKTVLLKGNAAYSFVLNLLNTGDDVNITMIIYNDMKEYILKFPRLRPTSEYVNITMGSIFVDENSGGAYHVKIIVSPSNTITVKLRIRGIGIVATPNLGVRGIIPSYWFWGDSIGPLATALLHYRPWMRDTVVEWVSKALNEIYQWRTDVMFYPPDKRWSFLYWDKERLDVGVLTIPRRGVINYASLEETLVSMIPLYILTGDQKLLDAIALNARLLNHDNYWKGLGYWSAWFGIWLHIWLFVITGDTWYWDEASYYLGTMTPFNQALHEEISNAAKFIEANIVAYYTTNDTRYLELAREMARILLEEFVDEDYGFLRTYIREQTLARHDMFAWTISPLISLHIGTWAPDWMLWLYPIALNDNGRPNGYFTLMNLTYTGNAIIIRQRIDDSVFLFKYNGFIIYPYGIKELKPASNDVFPYVAILYTVNDTCPILVGFNNTSGTVITSRSNNTFSIISDRSRTWIIYIGDREFTGRVDGEEIILGVNAVLYKGYLILEGTCIEINFSSQQ
ncbi:hypothetical protein J4526_06895 [Desulfurococcaceae archaeon MEX13E-LK6-19]|nr:hypothetical protein J4526_06895 [Desulfurococcaceae archaeon MEX13E-LK6-19]